MAIRKCIAVRLGVIYDSQGANWKQGGLPMRDPFPHHTPNGRRGVINDSQPAEIYKNTTRTRWKLLLFD
jgi:hypothetical protein